MGESVLAGFGKGDVGWWMAICLFGRNVLRDDKWSFIWNGCGVGESGNGIDRADLV